MRSITNLRSLSTYKSLQNDFTDKWLTFDGTKVCFCGSTYYAESALKTPRMCLLFADIDLLVRLAQFYSDCALEIYSMPKKDREGKVFNDRYIIGVDPKSLGLILVIK